MISIHHHADMPPKSLDKFRKVISRIKLFVSLYLVGSDGKVAVSMYSTRYKAILTLRLYIVLKME